MLTFEFTKDNFEVVEGESTVQLQHSVPQLLQLPHLPHSDKLKRVYRCSPFQSGAFESGFSSFHIHTSE